MDLSTAIFTALGVIVAAIVGFVTIRQTRKNRTEDKTDSNAGRPSTERVTQVPGPRRSYRIQVRNVGLGPMTEVMPSLVDELGKTASNPVDYLDTLAPQERAVFILEVSEPTDRNPLHVEYQWLDRAWQPDHYRSAVKVPTEYVDPDMPI
jgi:hypothetical protein